jgi:predicted house-cleaning noncanonical NTP pyrophosphatase (MazG superfamily)
MSDETVTQEPLFYKEDAEAIMKQAQRWQVRRLTDTEFKAWLSAKLVDLTHDAFVDGYDEGLYDGMYK